MSTWQAVIKAVIVWEARVSSPFFLLMFQFLNPESDLKPSLPLASPSMSLDGLAEKLEENKALRDMMREKGSLVLWPKPELVGVVRNLDAQRLNSGMLKFLADFWCPQWTLPTMIPLNDLKTEAVKN